MNKVMLEIKKSLVRDKQYFGVIIAEYESKTIKYRLASPSQKFEHSLPTSDNTMLFETPEELITYAKGMWLEYFPKADVLVIIKDGVEQTIDQRNRILAVIDILKKHRFG